MASDPLATFLSITATARATTPPPQVAGPTVNSFDSPLSKKVPGTLPCTSTHYVRDDRVRLNGSEMSGKVIGPMPLNDFLDAFLPPADDFVFSKAAMEKFDIVNKCETEVAMYKPLINAFQDFCPTLNLVDTHSRPDKNPGAHDYKPDISAYSKTCGAIDNTNFSLMDFQIEVKYNIEDDPFIDNPENQCFEHWTMQSRDTLGQLTSYALTHLGSQFRSFIFSLLLFKKEARIMRWDRAGAVATQLFPLHRVAEFLWRYNKAPPCVRGVDMSTTDDLPSDIQSTAREALRVNSKIPLLRFSVPRGDDEVYYIGAKPVFDGNSSLTGRSTRAFPVFDPETRRIVFLKDTWRIDLPEMVQEGHIYKQLNDAGVPNIAPFEMGADIPNHQTRTQDFVSKEWALPISRGLRPHQHYRLVLGIVGRPLSSFTSTWELVRAIRDAVCAHKHAYEKGKILHRDISVGNILIVENGGLLIDWDLCKPIGNSGASNSARQTERTGTWQFIAARLLKSTSVPVVHMLADDLESFFHVLTWMALRYTDHELKSNKLTSLMQCFFDECYPDDHHDGFGGGENKASFLISKNIVTTPKFKNPMLSSLLLLLCGTLAVRYDEPPSAAEEIEYRERRDKYGDDPTLIKLVDEHLVARYDSRMRCLETSDWMLEAFTKALGNRADWPADDKPVKHVVIEAEAGKKRKSDTNPDILVPHAGKRRRRTTTVVEEDDEGPGEVQGGTGDDEDQELSVTTAD